MLQRLTQRVAPRFSRGVSQVLAEPTPWNQAPTQITTLANGLRVATKESFGEVASVGVYIDAGTRSETAETAGSSYLMEQLALSGTEKRPKAKLESEVESMGATLRMNVGREQTAYSMSCFGADIKQGVDILTDLVTSPPVGNLDAQRESILRNLAEADQPTRAVIEDRLHLCAFRDCSLGLSSIGPFEGIDNLSSAHLKSYVNANHTADKMVLVATGAVNHAELVKQAEASLGGLSAAPAPAYGPKPYFCGAELLYRNDEMGPTAYISVGWESVPARSGDAVAFMVMQHIIGSYKKSAGLVPGNISGNRTINAVANKMAVGCADEFEAFNCFYKDTGMFGWYAACDEVAVEHCIGELMFGMNLLSFSVTDEEVERGKRELKAALFGGSGSAEASCAEVGKQVLAYGREVPAAEMVLRIDAIDAEEVKRVSWQYLNDSDVAITALGPLHGCPTYVDLRRSTTMHRY
jgi:processing peptidase subunit beta